VRDLGAGTQLHVETEGAQIADQGDSGSGLDRAGNFDDELVTANFNRLGVVSPCTVHQLQLRAEALARPRLHSL
jgi:hypothetical protein